MVDVGNIPTEECCILLDLFSTFARTCKLTCKEHRGAHHVIHELLVVSHVGVSFHGGASEFPTCDVDHRVVCSLNSDAETVCSGECKSCGNNFTDLKKHQSWFCHKQRATCCQTYGAGHCRHVDSRLEECESDNHFGCDELDWVDPHGIVWVKLESCFVGAEKFETPALHFRIVRVLKDFLVYGDLVAFVGESFPAFTRHASHSRRAGHGFGSFVFPETLGSVFQVIADNRSHGGPECPEYDTQVT